MEATVALTRSRMFTVHLAANGWCSVSATIFMFLIWLSELNTSRISRLQVATQFC